MDLSWAPACLLLGFRFAGGKPWALSAWHHGQHGPPGSQSPRWAMRNAASALLKFYSFHKEVRTPLQRLHELGWGVVLVAESPCGGWG